MAFAKGSVAGPDTIARQLPRHFGARTSINACATADAKAFWLAHYKAALNPVRNDAASPIRLTEAFKAKFILFDKKPTAYWMDNPVDMEELVENLKLRLVGREA